MQQSTPQLTQRAPILTVEQDMSAAHRLAVGAISLVAATVFALDALAALGSRKLGLLPIGLGRLCDYLLLNNIPGAGILAFLERGHLAVMLLVGALLLVFGRSGPTQPGPGQNIVFRRRASIRRQLPALFGSIGLLIAGAWLARHVHPLVAGVVELPATLLIGWVAWHAVIPEMRTAMTVINDTRQGFANRIEISGGIFNRIGRIIVRHDNLNNARLVEPNWTRLFSYRDILISPEHAPGYSWRIDAIAPADELNELAGYLNGDFKYALSTAALNFSTRFMGNNGGHWH